VRTLTRVAAVCVFVTLALGLAVVAHDDTRAGETAHFAITTSTPPSPTATVTDPVVPTGPTTSATQDDGRENDDTDPPAPHRSVTVLMSGDLLWHDTVWESAHEDAVRRDEKQRFDFDPMFAAMKPIVESADLAICHEEVPFATDDLHLSSYPVFAAPPEIARWIASMGWDACTVDSNHSIDQGFDGLVRTAGLLEKAGVRHVGTFRTQAERRKPVILTSAQGVKVGIVGGTYSLNGFTLPPDQRWAVSMWDADNLIAQAKAAKKAGADIVLVHYHGGDEYSRLPNAQQIALVRRLTASPYVDLVFAEHAHVVQPITKVNGKWVVYGMGNMVGQSDTAYPRAYEGISVRFTFRETDDGDFRVTRAAYIPTWWNHYTPGNPVRVLPVVSSLHRGVGDRRRLLEALRMTRLAVDGADPGGDTTPGLRQR
jgi:poly-gamma-glutamate synthesis protein (capsule biosynthesis protein)